MRARDKFGESIAEIVYLNEKAKDDSTNDKIYFKSIVLLLCAKLEQYVKDSTKEYIDALLEAELTKSTFPEKFIVEIINNELSKIQERGVETYIKNDRCKERARIFSLIWDESYKIIGLPKEEFAVSISNNGTTAFTDTYKKIRLPDIIKNLKDYSKNTETMGVSTTITRSVPDTINKLICMRNNIIHDDATPPITSNEILLYIEIGEDFVKQIDDILVSELQTVIEHTSDN